MSATTTSPVRDVAGGKFLTFVLAGEEYGLEILKVQEIMAILPITRVPRTPPHIRGVINLRGKVIPIVDLRCKLGIADDAPMLGNAAGTEAPDGTRLRDTCIIVVEVAGQKIGIIVDEVAEVRGITTGEIEPPPAFGTHVDTAFLLGLAKAEGRVRLLLDIERVLTADDIADLAALQDTAEDTAA